MGGHECPPFFFYMLAGMLTKETRVQANNTTLGSNDTVSSVFQGSSSQAQRTQANMFNNDIEIFKIITKIQKERQIDP